MLCLAETRRPGGWGNPRKPCQLQAGVKGTPITFLLTDKQIINEKFLVYINDLLSTGYIPDLCSQVRPMHSIHLAMTVLDVKLLREVGFTDHD